MMKRDESPECATCHTNGRRGYCALGRCYCGHPTCAAFASWTELPDISGDAPVPHRPRLASAWDAREGATWIDKL